MNLLHKIVVDSGCDLTDDFKNKNGINLESVPLSLQLGQDVYVDTPDLNTEDYLKAMEAYPELAKSAAPSPELFMEKFKGDESVFAVTISSLLSGSFSSAMLAKDMYLEKIGQKFIHVFDSLSAGSGETVVALKINELISKKLPETDIVDQVNKFIEQMKTYFILEKFDTLIKSGRMNPYVAKLASMLNIRPICAGIKGKIELVDKARGQKKAFSKLIDIICKETDDHASRILGITHVKCLEKALEFKDEILSRVKFKDVVIVDATGLCCTYANRGGIIVCY